MSCGWELLARLWKVEVFGCLAVLPARLLPQLVLPNSDPLVPTLCPLILAKHTPQSIAQGLQFYNICPVLEEQAVESEAALSLRLLRPSRSTDLALLQLISIGVLTTPRHHLPSPN